MQGSAEGTRLHGHWQLLQPLVPRAVAYCVAEGCPCSAEEALEHQAVASFVHSDQLAIDSGQFAAAVVAVDGPSFVAVVSFG